MQNDGQETVESISNQLMGEVRKAGGEHDGEPRVWRKRWGGLGETTGWLAEWAATVTANGGSNATNAV